MYQESQRKIRVFISSTFKDMQEERDYLVKFIFPQLRKICESRGVTWGEVDLRWGIPDEQSSEGKILPICLAEIDRCRPYFIGILGERYGWILERIDPELIASEAWLQQLQNHSVTELEILHGVLNNPEMANYALFYFRDPNYIKALDEEMVNCFIETPLDSEIEKYGLLEAQRRAKNRKNKLSYLKERIRESGIPLKENFCNAKQLGEWVLADLTGIIDQLFPSDELPDDLLKESFQHENFADSRSQVYIGGQKYYCDLDKLVKEYQKPICVLGESGSGKSALLANWGIKYRNENPETFTLFHFIGATPNSTNLKYILLRLMRELKKNFSLSNSIPEDEEELLETFPNWLYMASKKGNLLLVIDGLNQLENTLGAHELDWLPMDLPKNVLIVLSTLPCRALEIIKKRNWPTMTIEQLSISERIELINTYLAQYSKKLSSSQINRIINYSQSGNPLGLRILLNELRQFGLHEKLDLMIDHYLSASTIIEMFRLVLERCEADYELERPGLVRDSMRCIWAARRGISEAELLDILGSDNKPLPQRIWSQLYLALDSSLLDRNSLLCFSHDYIKFAVEEKYFQVEKDKASAHITLADYFNHIDWSSFRVMEELPWQLMHSKQWHRLYDLLADLEKFKNLIDKYENDLYIYWTSIESQTSLRKVDAYRPVFKKPDDIDLGVINELVYLFLNSGELEEAMELLKESERISRQLSDVDCLALTFENQAQILANWGKPEEAMELLKESERIYLQLGRSDTLTSVNNSQAIILVGWGRLEEAMELFKENERISRQLSNMGSLALSYGNQALILYGWGKLKEAMELLREEERICHQQGDINSLARSLGNQALILADWGRVEDAMSLHKEQERICRQLNNLVGLSISLNNQALILRKWGKLEEAMELLKESERINRHLGKPEGLANSLGNQALILADWGRVEDAMVLHKEEERICRQLNYKEGLSGSLTNQAAILRNWGRLKEAMSLHKESEYISRQLRDLHSLSISLANQALVLKDLGELEEALTLLKEQEKISRQLGDLDGLQKLLGNQAAILYDMDKIEEALILLREQADICRQLGNLDSLASSLGNQGVIFRNRSKLEWALAMHKEEECICREAGNLKQLSISLGNQALILTDWGKLNKATKLFKEAENICRQSGNIKGLCINLVNQSSAYRKLDDITTQLTLLNQARTIAMENSFTHLQNRIEEIIEIEKQK